MVRLWAASLAVALGLCVGSAQGQWRASAPPAPLVTLGRPVPLDAPPDADRQVTPVTYSVARGQNADQRPLPPGPPTLGQPYPTNGYYGGPQTVTAFAPPQVPPPVQEPYNCGVVAGNPVPPPAGAGGGLFGYECLGCTSCGTRSLFQSDHCFDNFISPVSNPFLFEDPRSLTEIRPIFIYQQAPHGNYFFRGGDMEFFGVQARVAVTERLSFVINKLGWTWLEPHNGGSVLGSHDGASELWLGPKFTFIRNETSGTLLAGGLTFQLPVGDKKVAQDTGTLSLVPYVSFAQNFGRSSFGSFNFMNTTGYAFATDNKRTDYFYSSFHVDFDIANAHKFYPLIELNWFQYTHSGSARNLGFEGRDLVNFGSTNVSGLGSLTIAPGLRYKLNEHAQAGFAVEFPLTSPKDLVDFRMTFDLILRY